jgi:hypothetical protein
MFKWIRKIILKIKLKDLLEQEAALSERRAKLVYKPELEEIPDKLDMCVKIAKQLKKIKKKTDKINKELDEYKN